MMVYKIQQFAGKGTLKILDVTNNPKKFIEQMYGDEEVLDITITHRILGGERYVVDCLDGNQDVYIVEEVK